MELTVKELITKLLDCDMDANVVIQVKDEQDYYITSDVTRVVNNGSSVFLFNFEK